MPVAHGHGGTRPVLRTLLMIAVGIGVAQSLRTATAAPLKTESAVFAAGCFWCTELAFEQIAGVVDVESGYTGGTAATAYYERVHQGTTRHAESIRVIYDPEKVTYEKLLDVFFAAHDPTQHNRQGELDVGRHYRSAIFYASESQHAAAEAKIKDLRDRKAFHRKIVTRVEPLETFYPAEDVHQNFARRNQLHRYIQMHAIPRAAAVREALPELIAPDR